jgi:hypothetical protein
MGSPLEDVVEIKREFRTERVKPVNLLQGDAGR